MLKENAISVPAVLVLRKLNKTHTLSKCTKEIKISFSQLTAYWFDPDDLKVRREWKLIYK